ncbi:MAG: sigma-70 family RNA polymerase sigma factor [SAR324 cluster bacterium]|uniref:RNA polymerase sigma factor n=1 Tax=SAR324 cluster bacterium TaxID=2024889 RepID=A0A7X9FPF4_9DELT|nr:sigma-70 family RNA polymerase sigma factor [SAR324 cluster bacterium]
MLEKKSDLELISGCKRGESESFEEIISRYSQKAYHLAFRLTRNPDDAEEVLQDVFVTVFRKIEGFKGESSFSSWLYRVTVNSALMKLRKKRQEQSVLLEDALPGFENSLFVRSHNSSEGEHSTLQSELLMALAKAIDNLPSDYRSVFILRDIDGLSSREVGRALNISIPAVKSRLHRSRLLLRRQLSNFYKDIRTPEDNEVERRVVNS